MITSEIRETVMLIGSTYEKIIQDKGFREYVEGQIQYHKVMKDTTREEGFKQLRDKIDNDMVKDYQYLGELRQKIEKLCNKIDAECVVRSSRRSR